MVARHLGPTAELAEAGRALLRELLREHRRLQDLTLQLQEKHHRVSLEVLGALGGDWEGMRGRWEGMRGRWEALVSTGRDWARGWGCPHDIPVGFRGQCSHEVPRPMSPWGSVVDLVGFHGRCPHGVPRPTSL